MANNSLSPIARHNPRFKVILNNLQNTFNIFPQAHIKIHSKLSRCQTFYDFSGTL